MLSATNFVPTADLRTECVGPCVFVPQRPLVAADVEKDFDDIASTRFRFHVPCAGRIDVSHSNRMRTRTSLGPLEAPPPTPRALKLGIDLPSTERRRPSGQDSRLCIAQS